jgi:hypothetical protein
VTETIMPGSQSSWDYWNLVSGAVKTLVNG